MEFNTMCYINSMSEVEYDQFYLFCNKHDLDFNEASLEKWFRRKELHKNVNSAKEELEEAEWFQYPLKYMNFVETKLNNAIGELREFIRTLK